MSTYTYSVHAGLQVWLKRLRAQIYTLNNWYYLQNKLSKRNIEKAMRWVRCQMSGYRKAKNKPALLRVNNPRKNSESKKAQYNHAVHAGVGKILAQMMYIAQTSSWYAMSETKMEQYKALCFLRAKHETFALKHYALIKFKRRQKG